MSFDLKPIIFAIRANFWFIPSLLAVLAVLAALMVAQTDPALYGISLPLLPKGGLSIESARVVLSTIAGSMITAASLVFSLTLVALTQVSQQLGPRILIRFMDDRPTQIVLGVYIATFAFSLIVLFSIDEQAVAGRVSGLGVVLSAGLAVIALGAMIHFIHHIANRIQADVLIAALGRDLNVAASALNSSADQTIEIAERDDIEELESCVEDAKVMSVRSAESGYLSGFNAQKACEIGLERGITLRARTRPGAFVLAGTQVLEACGVQPDIDAKVLEDELQSVLQLSERRTPEASIEFELNALVEVALRALSPGINDPFTAIACIDRLSDGLRILMEQKSDHRVARDGEGKIRLVYIPEPFERYLELAFSAIIMEASGNALVKDRLSTALANLCETSPSEQHRTTIEAVQQRL